MNAEKLNEVLKEVIEEVRNLKIPVPFTISEQIKVNPRPKKRFGCCRKQGEKFIIEISEFILKCDDEKIRGVIAHEVLHTCEGCYEHGMKWKEYASQMNAAYGYNIKRTSSNEEMGIADEGRSGEYSGSEGTAGGSGSADRSDTVDVSGFAGRQGSSSTGAIKYIIRCRKCGREYPRQRCSAVVKKPKAYRCRCGGRLTVFEIRRIADLCMKKT